MTDSQTNGFPGAADPEAETANTAGVDDHESDGRSEREEIDVEVVVAERDHYLDQLQRTMADFANYRRRTEQERVMARQLATRDLLRALVPVVDDFERAMAAIPKSDRDTGWVQGVELIQRKFDGVLAREGVEPIDPLGQPFDPAFHEAVATDAENRQNVVVEVYQKGYRQGEHLLRPAMVKVGNLAEEA